MMKKIHFSLFSVILLLCLALSQTVSAADTNYVVDDAGLFSSDEIEEIAEEIAQLQSETNMDYLVVTTDDAQGMSAQDYAERFFEDTFPEIDTSGMIYLIDMDNREIYIATYEDIQRYLTDERINYLLDDAYEYVADGEYSNSALSVLQNIGEYMESGIVQGQYIYDSETGEKDYYEGEKGFPILALVFGVIAGLASALITFFSVKARYNLTYETYRYPLSEKSTLSLNVSEDRLVNKFVTHRRIPKNPPSSSSGGSRSGRTTVHRSSGGRRAGGGGRRF